ncbi:MAG: oxidoreductase [Candidatus Solibacter sp.]|jgi:protein-disulfide isomerase|nr:oxidoreductase [Candidatus Solibacter sp.]
MSKLTPPISKRDHYQGSLDAPVIMVEYGDYECPHCKAAYPNVKVIQTEFGDELCFVYRHFPLVEIHPQAEPAAEAAEVAGAQGHFWDMHDMLFENSPALEPPHLLTYAAHIGLDIPRFVRELRGHIYVSRVQEDIESGMLSGVSGTPTFFINGIRHEGSYDLASLVQALNVAQTLK